MSYSRLAFYSSIVVTAFFWGFVAAQYHVFPYHAYLVARASAVDLRDHWRSYANVEPSRWLAPSRKAGSGVTVWDRERAQDGLTLVSSLLDGDVSLALIDLDGRLTHLWRIRFLDIWSPTERSILGIDPVRNWDVGVMGGRMESDGSVLFTFNGGGLVKLDKCGRLVWKRTYLTHHSIVRSEDGSYWLPSAIRHGAIDRSADPPLFTRPYEEDTVLQLDSAGAKISEVSVPRMLLENDLEGVLFANGVTATTNLTADYTHLNKVSVLLPSQAVAFPMFSTGDVLISLRNLDLLVVFEPRSRRVKWYQTGPWLRQHDAEFTEAGLISLFDNHSDNAAGKVFGGSRILTIDPATRRLSTAYKGDKSFPFYSEIEGEHVYLPNGNLLISEASAGRLFEVTSSGAVVWEYINRFDRSRVVAETHAYARIPRSEVEAIDWSCKRSF